MKLCALSSELQVLEDDFSEVEKIVEGYLNSSPRKSSILRVSRSTPTEQSSIKEQSKRIEEEISKRKKELSKAAVQELEKTCQDCQRELERRFS